MSGTNELDQVAEARRRLAEHAGYPLAYWIVFAVALVLIAGLPIWMSYLPSDEWTYLSWAVAALAVASAVYSVQRRRRSGVYLTRRIGAYPTAWRIWLAGIIVTVVGYFGINLLVQQQLRVVALWVLVPFAVAVFVLQVSVHAAIRRDIEAGRVTP